MFGVKQADSKSSTWMMFKGGYTLVTLPRIVKGWYTLVTLPRIVKGWYTLVTLPRIINPLNAELNPICYLLALLGAHHFLHASRIRVKSLTLRVLMSYTYIYIYIYIYMEHLFLMFLDHTQRHNDAPQSVGLLWTSDQLVAETST